MNPARDIAGCILAGGQSRRMGEDKARFILDGSRLLDRAIERLRPQAASLIINVHEDRGDLGRYGLPVVTDPEGDHLGPLAGILAALRWAARNNVAWITTAAVDTPFFPRDLVAKLADAAAGKDMAVARSGERLHPVFGLWKATLAPQLAEFIESSPRSVHHWALGHDAGVAEWPVQPYDPFFNINGPADVSTALEIQAEFRP
ncbi:molybdenum cofactor guanylyltransferase MobA [Taklimakanibacter lacteus]|uniref:molybdenum cofactor guanylyltransferase MobA n=1 Tax=Taklimakanibacter lacteus TaxID=2268456 RepID=UPI000E6742B7